MCIKFASSHKAFGVHSCSFIQCLGCIWHCRCKSEDVISAFKDSHYSGIIRVKEPSKGLPNTYVESGWSREAVKRSQHYNWVFPNTVCLVLWLSVVPK